MQGCKLYVGNLNYSTTEEQLAEFFAEYGEVKTANIIEGRGFGFVEMATPEEADSACEAANDVEFMGRTLRVDKARESSRRNSEKKPGGFRRGSGSRSGQGRRGGRGGSQGGRGDRGGHGSGRGRDNSGY